MKLRPFVVVFAGALALVGAPSFTEALESEVAREWLQEMKTSPRGPFRRIRWFCRDGTVLPPGAYACSPHGGGVQHGEWSERTLKLRDGGYKIANVLAGLDPQALMEDVDYPDTVKQILLEQFLIAIDDGWILRKARFYRGAFQTEDELAGARRLLQALNARPEWAGARLLPFRIAARLLPHGGKSASVAKVRQASSDLASRDERFTPLRNRIHARLEAADAERVRDYASQVSNAALGREYQELSDAIDAIFNTGTLTTLLDELVPRLRVTTLADALRSGAARLTQSTDAAERVAATAQMMAAIRRDIDRIQDPSRRLAALDLSLALEVEHFAQGARLGPRRFEASRREQLDWLRASALALYGASLITSRELEALNTALMSLAGTDVSLSQYKNTLSYLARVPGWGDRRLRFHFGEMVQKFARVEPLSELFMQDQLRGSPLLFFSKTVDALLRDANRIAGVRHRLFADDIGAGLRALNPGIARGTLRLATGGGGASSFSSDGVYLLPETTADLPPVAGILTAGEGNPLSHVQLLARNLGIPNVGIDQRLIQTLSPYAGTRVVLAVSPGGSVQLVADDGGNDALFDKEASEPETLIRPDLEKLNLQTSDLLRLSDLRARDSGRVVGPKAAKLGELHHHYPQAVADGLAIPFGVFRELLDRPMEGEGSSVFAWMESSYAAVAAMPEGSAERRGAMEALRFRLQSWLLSVDPGNAFRNRLRAAMAEVFGEDGSYGVFVRSDTNVEDLPGFTGAGLNLTVANVVGVDNVLRAIPRVWASPFSERAFAWRQSHMDKPQHVYPAILLLRSVPAEKSGVLVTQDVDTGDRNWLSVAVNEGVGGAVDGQAAESLRIHLDSGETRLLAQATAPLRRTVLSFGGLSKMPVSGRDHVLEAAEIEQLRRFAQALPETFPAIVDAAGRAAPADVEFGFLAGELKLFQIRPFLESARARSSEFLRAMDDGIRAQSDKLVILGEPPMDATR